MSCASCQDSESISQIFLEGKELGLRIQVRSLKVLSVSRTLGQNKRRLVKNLNVILKITFNVSIDCGGEHREYLFHTLLASHDMEKTSTFTEYISSLQSQYVVSIDLLALTGLSLCANLKPCGLLRLPVTT